MTADSFIVLPEAHDPGGKVRLRIQPGVSGDAVFSACGRYRTVLRRWWGDPSGPYVLWVAMNPSTASYDVDDPTIRKEMKFTRRDGYSVFVKVNVMDYRATNPKDLLAPGVEPCSPDNLPTIAQLSRNAASIIMAFGTLKPRHRVYAAQATRAILATGKTPMCLGTSKDGSPLHPLYQLDETAYVQWDAEGWLRKNS